MMFRVTISDLRAAADKLKQAVADYGAATDATKAAADTVAAGWEGDARNAFVEEQEQAIAAYRAIAAAVEVYIAAINAAANTYEVFDIQGINIIRA